MPTACVLDAEEEEEETGCMATTSLEAPDLFSVLLMHVTKKKNGEARGQEEEAWPISRSLKAAVRRWPAMPTA